MQGAGRRDLAKSHQISTSWVMVSLLKGAGKSRENRLCSAGWRSRLRPDTGDCPLEPVLASNLQHLHFSECQLEPWETRWDSELGTLTPQQSCLALTGAGNRGAGTVPKPSAARLPLPTQDRGKCRLGLRAAGHRAARPRRAPGARRPRHSDHRDGKALCLRRRKRWLITVWLEVRVLPAPPRSPVAENSWLCLQRPEWAGFLFDRWVSETADPCSGGVLALFSPPRKSRFPATETAVGRDSVRMGSYWAGSPSIWCWRDHSAGRSARRTTPMPCGRRLRSQL
jgi:hypothetical protein